MNRKLSFLSIATCCLAALTSCSNSDMPPSQNGNGVTFTVEIPDGLSTRGFNQGSAATHLIYAVYDSQTGKLIYSSDDAVKPTITVGDRKFDVTFDLVNGKDYDFMFWADQDVAGLYTFDFESKSMDIDYTKLALNEDSGDAFYNVVKSVRANRGSQHSVTLRRPFAQINLGTDDLEKVAGIDGTYVKEVKMTVEGAYSHLDLFSGKASEAAAEGVTFTASSPLPSEEFPVKKEDAEAAPYEYLAMGYVLTGVALMANEDGSEGTDVQKAQQEIMDLSFELTLSNKDDAEARTTGTVEIPVPNAPVQRNYRTNIYGSLLTSPSIFHIIIEPDFCSPDQDIP